MTRPPHEWEPEYIGSNAKRTLAPGSFTLITFADSKWTTDGHVIVRDVKGNSVTIPAGLIGPMLTKARDNARPQDRFYWYDVKLWVCRLEDDGWTWFEDDSSAAMSYLPWKREDGESIVSTVMEE